MRTTFVAALLSLTVLAGCVADDTPPPAVVTAFDVTGGFAGPGAPVHTRTAVMATGEAMTIRFAFDRADGVEVVAGLESSRSLIEQMARPGPDAELSGVTVHTLWSRSLSGGGLKDARDTFGDLARDADGRTPSFDSQCADCNTFGFHHFDGVLYDADVYGADDEFPQPWRDWIDEGFALRSFAQEGACLGECP